jgi:hypothetical protein
LLRARMVQRSYWLEHSERMTAVMTVSVWELASGLGVCIRRPCSQEGGHVASQHGPSRDEGYSVIKDIGEGLKGILAENVDMLLSPVSIQPHSGVKDVGLLMYPCGLLEMCPRTCVAGLSDH